MRYRSIFAVVLLLVALHTQATLIAQGALPLRNGRPVVAVVNRDSISLDEFVMQLDSPSAADRSRLQLGRATAKDADLLSRLVTIKLIVQEAHRMGLDEVPEIRKQVEVTSREILREVLLDRLVKNVQPDPAAVEKVFRESVREWKTESLLFQDEAAAKRAQKELASSAPFAQVAARYVGVKVAQADSDASYHAKKDYLPQIADALAKLQVGQVSPVIHLPAGFVAIKVIGIRYPENREARVQARKQVVGLRREEFMKAHEETLRRQYVVVNKALLKAVDYEAAKPGVDALLADKRVVAEIKGGASVTVGDLTDYVRMQFFHGEDAARQHKEMNAKKEVALDATIGRRLLNMEAVKLGIEKTNAYRDRVRGYTESLVFDTFLQKVIVPPNKMKEEEVKTYYNAHLKDYSNPEMMKLRSLAFARRNAAENAMKKLREGTEHAWMVANAEGQVDKGAPGLLTLPGTPITTDSMPPGMQKALVKSKAGDVRLYASPEGPFYVLSVQQVIAPSAKPYNDVREDVAKRAWNEKLKKAVEDYAGKLRAQSKVETYLKRVQ